MRQRMIGRGVRQRSSLYLRLSSAERMSSTTTLNPATDQSNAKVVEGSNGLLLEIDGQIVPNYDATVHPFQEGDVVTGQVVRIDNDEVLVDIGYKSEGVIPVLRALDPQVGRSERRGVPRRGGRRPRPDQGGPGRAPDPVQEARPVREGLAPHRGRRRVGRAGRGRRDRGRQGRADHRPRGARLPARLAGRHPPGAQPRRVHGPGDRVQGDRAQPLAQQRRAVSARRASRSSARRTASGSSTACSPARSSRARSPTSSTSARSSTSTGSTA